MSENNDSLEQRTISPAWNALHVLPGGSTIKAGIDVARYIKSERNDGRLPIQRPDALSVYAKRLGSVLYMGAAVVADAAKLVYVYQPLLDKIF